MSISTHTYTRTYIHTYIYIYIYIYMHIRIYVYGYAVIEETDSPIINGGCRIHRPSTSVLDMTLNNLMVLYGIWSTLSLPSVPGPRWPGVVAPDMFQSMGQIELNWITWDINCVLMQNWIVWIRTIFDIERVFTPTWIVSNRTVLTFNCV